MKPKKKKFVKLSIWSIQKFFVINRMKHVEQTNFSRLYVFLWTEETDTPVKKHWNKNNLLI